MDTRSLKRQKLIALFFLGFILLNGPILSLFKNGTVAGIPSLYFYMFSVWFGIILIKAFIIEKSSASSREWPKE